MEPVPSSPADNNREISMDAIASLLAMARQRISEGNPSLALQAVLIALRATGGEGAVLQALSRARDMYHTDRQAVQVVDELSSLFAGCGITDMQSVNMAVQGHHPAADIAPVPSAIQDMEMMQTSSSVPPAAPILAESGRLQVVLDASSDGSSFVCVQCGGVVSNLRRDEHIQFWCSPSAT